MSGMLIEPANINAHARFAHVLKDMLMCLEMHDMHDPFLLGSRSI